MSGPAEVRLERRENDLLLLHVVLWGAFLLLHLALFRYSFPRTPPFTVQRMAAAALALGALAVSARRGRREPDAWILSLALLEAAALVALRARGVTVLRVLIGANFVTGVYVLTRAWSLGRTRLHGVLLSGCTLILLAHLGLGVGELAMRWMMRGSDGTRMPCLSYGNTLWKMADLYDGEQNSLGFRERELDEFKPPGTTRVLFMGDSVTFGLGIPLEQTFIRRLQQRLDGRHVELINAGWPGYNTAQEFELLRRKGLYYDPDAVVVVFFPNDVEGAGSEEHPNTIHPYLDGLYENSLFYSYLQSRWGLLLERLGMRESYLDFLARLYHSPAYDAWQARLYNIKVWCRHYHKRLGLVLFPFMDDLGRYRVKYAHDMVASTARAYGIPCLDLLPAFAGQNEVVMQLNPSFDHHPSAEANRVAAEALYHFVAGLLADQKMEYRNGSGPLPRGSHASAASSRTSTSTASHQRP